jgi:Cof subfamily protein (haloacid dehalogenase superfamily)
MQNTAELESQMITLDPRLIVCDLDGTLLSDDQTISEYTLDIFAKVRERGMKICIASGRANQMMSIFQHPYLPCDYHIAFNGGSIEDVKQRAVIYQKSMDLDASQKVLAYAAHHHLILTMYSGDTMYYSQGEATLINRIANYEQKSLQCGVKTKINAVGISFEAYPTLPAPNGLNKIVVYENDPVKTSQFNAFIATIPNVCTENTGYGLTGVFDKTVSKGAALAWLGSKLAIKKAEICAFGDFDNDLSLFEAAGLNVAVENATESVKHSASFLTLSNNQDGVAWFIENRLLKN